MPKKRKAVTISIKQAVWEKTGGRCHVCGRVLKFDAKRDDNGYWQVDHIVAHSRGGRDGVKNYLPICRTCNGLKWNNKGRKVRMILEFGILAIRQIRSKTRLGRAIKKLSLSRIKNNEKRRKRKRSKWHYR